MVNTVELRSMKRVCVQNFDRISLLVAEIKQYHFACINEGQMKVSCKVNQGHC